jgi:hypothetical protein
MDYIKYKLIEGYDNYIIFTTGKIYSKKRKIFIGQYIIKNYYSVSLCNNNNQKTFKLHRLLALAFIPNPNNLPSVDHIDINQLNNNLENLRWASRTKQVINQNTRITNTTGCQGVNSDGTRYRAKWIINKKPYSKSFSIKKYGEEEALRLAIEFRKAMEEKYYKNLI